jgi:hypothetical protein
MLGSLVLLAAGSAYAGDNTAAAGTDGTSTAWENGKVLLVEVCDKAEDGGWDYPTCVRALREKVPTMLCKRGPGTYKWAFQVGAEKSKLDQVTNCKGG